MQTQIRIVGGTPLEGCIQVSGAKNAALPLLVTCLLTDQEVVLNCVPRLADVDLMLELLEFHGVFVKSFGGNTVCLQAKDITQTMAPYELVKKMRASVLVLGPLLARCGKARVSLPGGCSIGMRPIDLHLEGLKALGADIELCDGYIEARAPKGLIGATVTFPFVSVGATENLMLAATLAKGTTHLIQAAREPEIIDLAICLRSMGAKIEGDGTDHIIIEGVQSLSGATHNVIPDRIEIGTYAIAAAITGGMLEIKPVFDQHILSILSFLSKAGVDISYQAPILKVSGKNRDLKGVDLLTEPFPGFPTDLQAQWMTLMCLAQGASLITETIFENRFMHVPELARMGAHITVHGRSALVRGVKELKGARVMATDLRASVSLVLAGLAASGETFLSRVYHLDRGYELLEDKLRRCNACIERIRD